MSVCNWSMTRTAQVPANPHTCLASRRLAKVGLEHASHENFVDVGALQAGLLESGGDGNRPELGACHRGQCAIEGAQGSTLGTNNIHLAVFIDCSGRSATADLVLDALKTGSRTHRKRGGVPCSSSVPIFAGRAGPATGVPPEEAG